MTSRGWLLCVAALLAAAPGYGLAADLTSWTVDGGGGTMSGGTWVLNGTFGQPDAGVMAGSTYTLFGGFWLGGAGVAAVDPREADASALPGALGLPPAYPNPFNPSATIAFDLPASARARVWILNVRGELVATLLDEERAAGRHRVAWDGRNRQGANVASGVYLVVVQAGGKSVSQAISLIR